MAEESNQLENKAPKMKGITGLINKLKSSETFAEGEKELKKLWNDAKSKGKESAKTIGRAIIHGLAAQVAKQGLPLLAKLGTKALALINHESWYADADKSVSGLISAFKPVSASDSGNKRLICGLGIIPLSIDKMIDLSILRDQVTTAISTFDSMLGNPSGLDYDQIIDVLKAGAKVVALLTIGLRHYNGRKAKLITNTEVFLQNSTSVHELNMEHLTASPATAFLEGYREYRYDMSDDTYTETEDTNSKIILPTYPTISNNVWNTEIVSPACGVFCPDKVYELINYLYTGYFTNGPEQGINGLIMFMEDSLLISSSANWQTVFISALADYRTKLAVNPFLEQFMTSLGFGKPLSNKANEYNRWRAADIYNVYQDSGIICAVSNYMTFGMYGTPNIIGSGRYKSSNDSLDILDNSDDVDITFDPNNILITNIPLGHIGSLIKLWLMKPATRSTIYSIGVIRSIGGSPIKATYKLLTHGEFRNIEHSFDMPTALADSISNFLSSDETATVRKAKVRKFILFLNDKLFNENTVGLSTLEVIGIINSKDFEYRLNIEAQGSDSYRCYPIVASRSTVVDGTDTFTVNDLGDIVKVMKTNVTTHYNFATSYKKALELWNQTNNISKF